MLNELYTFAEPVQVVPFSSLKWGKFTLLHTHIYKKKRATQVALNHIIICQFATISVKYELPLQKAY